MIMIQVSFAGASLVTSFFLARRGKAFLQPGQDIEIAVIIIIIMMMIMIQMRVEIIMFGKVLVMMTIARCLALGKARPIC